MHIDLVYKPSFEHPHNIYFHFDVHKPVLKSLQEVRRGLSGGKGEDESQVGPSKIILLQAYTCEKPSM